MRRIAIVATLASLAAGLMLAAPAQAHVPFCVETVNPHGQNVPPAGSTTLPGPNGGINDDGFYRVGSDAGTDVTLRDTDGNVFGVFPSGTRVKYTEANGAPPSVKKIGSTNGQASAVDFHIKGSGDLVVVSVDGRRATCPVPPPPK
jgi:opacity protein-like surface antigen